MTTRTSSRASRERFDPGLIERLQLQYGGPSGVDVEAVVDLVLDMCKRKAVLNPSGLLVEWVRKRAKQIGGSAGLSPAQREAELERYADFNVETFRLVAGGSFTPATLAQFLDDQRRAGMAAINPKTIDRLRAMGVSWDVRA